MSSPSRILQQARHILCSRSLLSTGITAKSRCPAIAALQRSNRPDIPTQGAHRTVCGIGPGPVIFRKILWSEYALLLLVTSARRRGRLNRSSGPEGRSYPCPPLRCQQTRRWPTAGKPGFVLIEFELFGPAFASPVPSEP